MYNKGRDTLKQLDKLLDDLRAEARTGFGSHEVRRYWIQAELAAARQARHKSNLSRENAHRQVDQRTTSAQKTAHSIDGHSGTCAPACATTAEPLWLDGSFNADELCTQTHNRILCDTGEAGSTQAESDTSVDEAQVLSDVQQRAAREYHKLCRTAKSVQVGTDDMTTAAAGGVGCSADGGDAVCASSSLVCDSAESISRGVTVSAMRSRVEGWRQSLQATYWTVLSDAVADEAHVAQQT